MRRLPPLLLLSLTALAPPAAAQERGQTGLTMGYPASLGVIWHATDKIVIRPDISMSRTSSESETSFFGESSSLDGWSVSVGASGLFYLRKWDTVRSYVSPRLAFGRSSFDTSSDFGPSTAKSISAFLSFGVQYTPVRKFSVFGETGYGFSRGTSETDTPIGSTSSTSHSWNSRSGVGIIFYFGR